MKKHTLIVILFFLAASINGSAQRLPAWKFSDLKTAMDTASGPTVFNFWATFCTPCLKELPYFEAAAKQYKEEGVRVILVSLDLQEAYPKKIQQLVAKRKLTTPVVFLDETNADLFIPAVDSTWSGAIPASLFLNPKKGYRKFLEEEFTREKLDAEIQKML